MGCEVEDRIGNNGGGTGAVDIEVVLLPRSWEWWVGIVRDSTCSSSIMFVGSIMIPAHFYSMFLFYSKSVCEMQSYDGEVE